MNLPANWSDMSTKEQHAFADTLIDEGNVMIATGNDLHSAINAHLSIERVLIESGVTYDLKKVSDSTFKDVTTKLSSLKGLSDTV
jgi:hypothetical protein